MWPFTFSWRPSLLLPGEILFLHRSWYDDWGKLQVRTCSVMLCDSAVLSGSSSGSQFMVGCMKNEMNLNSSSQTSNIKKWYSVRQLLLKQQRIKVCLCLLQRLVHKVPGGGASWDGGPWEEVDQLSAELWQHPEWHADSVHHLNLRRLAQVSVLFWFLPNTLSVFLCIDT